MKSHGIPLEEAIRIEAYLLSERSGHPSGSDAMFWAQAEEIIHGRVAATVGGSVVPPTKKKAVRKSALKDAPAVEPMAKKVTPKVKAATKPTGIKKQSAADQPELPAMPVAKKAAKKPKKS